MPKTALRLYHSIRLNLGIKRFLKLWWMSLRYFIDNALLFPVFIIIQKYFFLRVVDHYGADYRWGDERSQNLDTKTDNAGYGLLHYSMVKNLRPKHVLCVGSMYGFIPYMLSKACQENKIGHVDFVDAAYDFNDKAYRNNHYFGQGFWRRADVKRHFSYLLNESYISTYVMTLEEFLQNSCIRYDYVFLDADHSYKGLVRDIRLVWPRMTARSILGIHDIEFDFKKSLNQIDGLFKRKVEHVTFGVKHIWQQIAAQGSALPILNGYSGVGFVYKKSSKSPPPEFA